MGAISRKEIQRSIKRMNRPFVHAMTNEIYRTRTGWDSVLYDNPLVYIGDDPLPQSSTYVWGRATLVDSARNAEGRMLGAVIRVDVAKIELTWNFLYRRDLEHLARLSSGFTYPQMPLVRFYYPPAGGFVRRQMYTSDLTGGTPALHGGFDDLGLPRGHDNIRLALVEV